MTVPVSLPAESQWHGSISELAVMLPLKRGRVPGERRTYEERARDVLSRLAAMARQGLVTPFNKIPSLHFGHVKIIRPEHYLRFAALDAADRRIPLQQDDFTEVGGPGPDVREWRSWLTVLVIFDGDAMAYLREIAEYIEDQFDRLFANCEDYPGADDFDRLWSWVRHYQISSDLLFSAYPNLTVARIKRLEAFKRRFDAFVEKVRLPTGRKVEDIDELFDEFLKETAQEASGFPYPSGVYRVD